MYTLPISYQSQYNYLFLRICKRSNNILHQSELHQLEVIDYDYYSLLIKNLNFECEELQVGFRNDAHFVH